MPLIQRLHMECSRCGQVWPAGQGYGAGNVLLEDLPKGWKIEHGMLHNGPLSMGAAAEGREDLCPGCSTKHNCADFAVGVEGRGWACTQCRTKLTGD